MSMTENELDEVCAEVAGYFPALSARMAKAPKLLALWRRTLQPFSISLIHDAIARVAAKNSRTLELDDLLAAINHLMAAQQKIACQSDPSSAAGCPLAPRTPLTLLARRARTREERLIAKLHCETVYRGLNLPKPDVQHKAAAQWRQWAQEYPAIREHCLKQAEMCCSLATAGLKSQQQMLSSRAESV
jgi:hypothetical protein